MKLMSIYKDIFAYLVYTFIFIYPLEMFRFSSVKNFDWVYWYYLFFTMLFFAFRSLFVKYKWGYFFLYPILINFVVCFIVQLYYFFIGYGQSNINPLKVFAGSFFIYFFLGFYALSVLLMIFNCLLFKGK